MAARTAIFILWVAQENLGNLLVVFLITGCGSMKTTTEEDVIEKADSQNSCLLGTAIYHDG